MSLKAKKKKITAAILSCIMCATMMTGNFSTSVSACDLLDSSVVTSVTIGAATSTFGSLITEGLKTATQKIYSWIVKSSRKHQANKYKGYRKLPESIRNIKDIAEGKSEIKIYGQEKAKSQCFSALSGCLQRIEDSKKGKTNSRTMRGNVVYMVGPSGVGKTTMARAIANAVLKHDEKSSLFIDSGDISGDAELGKQLFKTVMKFDIGKNRVKNLFGMGDMGIYQKETESPMLDHILEWPECVIIIDEYDKMKLKSKAPGTDSDMSSMFPFVQANTAQSVTQVTADGVTKLDKSADELLKSIASTGKYRVSFDEIDCSKVLFLITTNETREELEKNFGINGKTGGGIQRLNVIEFDYLSLDACKQIAADTIEEVRNDLTSSNGDFRLKNIYIDDQSLTAMAQHIFKNKDMQGRAKYALKDEILNIFTSTLGEDTNKEFDIHYTDSESVDEIGTFTRNPHTANSK